MEDKKYDEELDVEMVDDEDDAFEDEDVEEYNFNDQDDETDEESEEESEEESGEETEDISEDMASESENTDTAEAKESAEVKADKEFELKLLNELGYNGNYEEARAAYEAEKAGATAETSNTTQKTDYNALAEQMLKEINAEYGLELKDFSQFEDIEKFAELSLDDSYGAVKAFAATNHKLVIEGARNKAKQELLGKLKPASKDHLGGLPKAKGGATVSDGTRISKKEYNEIKALYPNMTKAEIFKVARRVIRNTKS